MLELVRHDLTDEEAKEKAKFLYLNMTPPRLTAIAKRTGRDKAVIEQWRDEGAWLDIRSSMREQKRKEIEKCLGGIAEYDNKIAECARKLIDVIEDRLGEPTSVRLMSERDLRNYLITLERSVALRNKLIK